VFADMNEPDHIGVDDLLRLAHDKSAESRKQLVGIIGDLFFDRNTVLTEAERTIMSEILRQLIQDAELTVRKHLAIRLSDEPHAPHNLVLALANDDAEVELRSYDANGNSSALYQFTYDSTNDEYDAV
jgi:uncharacterized protein (DUF2336 family)